eukprot:gnl/MRDRNA2_/MRDRNA2_91160_c0_seq1.p1 gnl/MRDRNA2_/MRDRNA2_91160_c0~~gnl/MRDRNA2_/MRDRNA2_91160_c0_seq1.p1  ORF type:complete len:287 (-),score=75.70 gnl/MRDRNA2_/MRDRNA2_91160_c0_seq1:188-1048(-)
MMWLLVLLCKMNILVCTVGFSLEHQSLPERGSCLLQSFKDRGTTRSVTEDLSDFQHTLQEHAKLEVALAQTLQDDAKLEVALAQRRTARQPNAPQQTSVDNSVLGKLARADRWFWGDPEKEAKPDNTSAHVHQLENNSAGVNATNATKDNTSKASTPAGALTTLPPSSESATAAPSSTDAATTQAPSSQSATEPPSSAAAVTTQAPSSPSATEPPSSAAAVTTEAPSSKSATEAPSSAAAVTTEAPSSKSATVAPSSAAAVTTQAPTSPQSATIAPSSEAAATTTK